MNCRARCVWTLVAVFVGSTLTLTAPRVSFAQATSKATTKSAAEKASSSAGKSTTEKTNAAKAGASSSKTSASKGDDSKQRGRLPAYYSKVVDDTQREKIYAINDQYADRVKKVQDELDALLAERNSAVEKVLTKKQLDEVAKLREAAKQRRSAANLEEDVEMPAKRK